MVEEVGGEMWGMREDLVGIFVSEKGVVIGIGIE